MQSSSSPSPAIHANSNNSNLSGIENKMMDTSADENHVLQQRMVQHQRDMDSYREKANTFREWLRKGKVDLLNAGEETTTKQQRFPSDENGKFATHSTNQHSDVQENGTHHHVVNSKNLMRNEKEVHNRVTTTPIGVSDGGGPGRRSSPRRRAQQKQQEEEMEIGKTFPNHQPAGGVKGEGPPDLLGDHPDATIYERLYSNDTASARRRKEAVQKLAVEAFVIDTGTDGMWVNSRGGGQRHHYPGGGSPNRQKEQLRDSQQQQQQQQQPSSLGRKIRLDEEDGKNNGDNVRNNDDVVKRLLRLGKERQERLEQMRQEAEQKRKAQEEASMTTTKTTTTAAAPLSSSSLRRIGSEEDNNNNNNNASSSVAARSGSATFARARGRTQVRVSSPSNNNNNNNNNNNSVERSNNRSTSASPHHHHVSSSPPHSQQPAAASTINAEYNARAHIVSKAFGPGATEDNARRQAKKEVLEAQKIVRELEEVTGKPKISAKSQILAEEMFRKNKVSSQKVEERILLEQKRNDEEKWKKMQYIHASEVPGKPKLSARALALKAAERKQQQQGKDGGAAGESSVGVDKKLNFLSRDDDDDVIEIGEEDNDDEEEISKHISKGRSSLISQQQHLSSQSRKEGAAVATGGGKEGSAGEGDVVLDVSITAGHRLYEDAVARRELHQKRMEAAASLVPGERGRGAHHSYRKRKSGKRGSSSASGSLSRQRQRHTAADELYSDEEEEEEEEDPQPFTPTLSNKARTLRRKEGHRVGDDLHELAQIKKEKELIMQQQRDKQLRALRRAATPKINRVSSVIAATLDESTFERLQRPKTPPPSSFPRKRSATESENINNTSMASTATTTAVTSRHGKICIEEENLTFHPKLSAHSEKIVSRPQFLLKNYAVNNNSNSSRRSNVPTRVPYRGKEEEEEDRRGGATSPHRGEKSHNQQQPHLSSNTVTTSTFAKELDYETMTEQQRRQLHFESLYNDGERRRQQKQQKQEELKEGELVGYTFKPHLAPATEALVSNATTELGGGGRATSPLLQSAHNKGKGTSQQQQQSSLSLLSGGTTINERQAIWQQRRDAKIQQLVEEKEEMEMKECVFTPRLAGGSSPISTQQQQQQDDEEMQNQQQQPGKFGSLRFTPSSANRKGMDEGVDGNNNNNEMNSLTSPLQQQEKRGYLSHLDRQERARKLKQEREDAAKLAFATGTEKKQLERKLMTGMSSQPPYQQQQEGKKQSQRNSSLSPPQNTSRSNVLLQNNGRRERGGGAIASYQERRAQNQQQQQQLVAVPPPVDDLEAYADSLLLAQNHHADGRRFTSPRKQQQQQQQVQNQRNKRTSSSSPPSARNKEPTMSHSLYASSLEQQQRYPINSPPQSNPALYRLGHQNHNHYQQQQQQQDGGAGVSNHLLHHSAYSQLSPQTFSHSPYLGGRGTVSISDVADSGNGGGERNVLEMATSALRRAQTQSEAIQQAGYTKV